MIFFPRSQLREISREALRRTEMYGFCSTHPYGFAVLVDGVLGYLRRGSTDSLAGGADLGGLL